VITCKHSGRPLRVAAFGLVEEYCVFFAEEHTQSSMIFIIYK
jgi:hypothetical protein